MHFGSLPGNVIDDHSRAAGLMNEFDDALVVVYNHAQKNMVSRGAEYHSKHHAEK